MYAAIGCKWRSKRCLGECNYGSGMLMIKQNQWVWCLNASAYGCFGLCEPHQCSVTLFELISNFSKLTYITQAGIYCQHRHFILKVPHKDVMHTTGHYVLYPLLLPEGLLLARTISTLHEWLQNCAGKWMASLRFANPWATCNTAARPERRWEGGRGYLGLITCKKRGGS